jgi:hypothetical protein
LLINPISVFFVKINEDILDFKNQTCMTGLMDVIVANCPSHLERVVHCRQDKDGIACLLSNRRTSHPALKTGLRRTSPPTFSHSKSKTKVERMTTVLLSCSLH